MKKIVLTAAITGAVHTPTLSKYLPITPDQIIDQAVEAANAGAAVVHLHGRSEKDGSPTSDPNVMKYIVDGVRSRCDVVIGITTGGAIGMSVEERLKAVPICKADLASCNAGSMNFCFADIGNKIEADGNAIYDWEVPFTKATYDTTFPNTFQGIEDYVKIMNTYHTKPEFEVYDLGMIYNLKYLKDKGKIGGKIYLQFVLGVLGGLPASIDNLLLLANTAKKVLGEDIVWSCAAAGKQQFNITTTAAILGGNARLGLEDNLYIEKGKLAKSSAEQIEKFRRILNELGIEIANPNEARQILLS
ncbi:3-keto-5-aminohexanoate cleavage protein [Peptoniphilus sp. GNH]|nr:hypothetical protein HMPREF3189_00856 [Clostridiales bacterium KA00134]UHR01941.1 3-keto-5-aminohexanoate cleavage protein [Peptoniphilus sp. GNH]